MTTSTAIKGMLFGLVGIGISLFWVRTRLIPRWAVPLEPLPTLPWRPVHLLLLFVGYVLSSQAVGLALRLIYGDMDRGELGVLPTLVASMFVFLLLAVGIWALGSFLGARLDAYGLHRAPNRGHFLRGAHLYLVSWPAIFGASLFWMGFLFLVGADIAPQDVAKLVQSTASHERWAVFLMAAVFVPIVEEFIFRGFLQTWLVKTRGALPGILITSLLFALLHGTTAFGPLMVISLAAGFARHITGSLWPAIAVHMCNNAFATIMLFQGLDI